MFVKQIHSLNHILSIDNFLFLKQSKKKFQSPFVRNSISRISVSTTLRIQNLKKNEVQNTLTQSVKFSSQTSSSYPLAYEILQGTLVRWSENEKSKKDIPTAILLHGILGNRKNLASFAKRLSQEFPSWQFLLVDLRCHGESTPIKKMDNHHSVDTAAKDVLQLVRDLRLSPRILIGHSFGGKVALSMIHQAPKPIPRSIKVWVLDSTPGKIINEEKNHPKKVINALKELPKIVSSRMEIVDFLIKKGFSKDIAQWMTTNLKPVMDENGLKRKNAYSFVFDLDGISEMYDSYEKVNLWPIVENVPEGVHVNFLRAENSLHRWAYEDEKKISEAQSQASSSGSLVEMHVLEDSGHWVHTDNPEGLFRIISPSFDTPTFVHN